MKVQKIDNSPVFKKLVIKNPQNMPAVVYSEVVKNKQIKKLTELMNTKGKDLVLEYESEDLVYMLLPKINFLNAKQFFNKYFDYTDENYSGDYEQYYYIRAPFNKHIKGLLEELKCFNMYDIRREVHEDVCNYFEKIFAEREENKITQNSDPSDKTSDIPAKNGKA